MILRFSVKVKDGHNPPSFGKDQPNGVLAYQDFDFPSVTKENITEPFIQACIALEREAFVAKYVECLYEEIDSTEMPDNPIEVKKFS